MMFLQLVAVSLGSLAVLFLLTKLTGNRQVSELTMFDYVIGISIGSIAAEMATELEEPLRPLTAMILYALAAIGISWLTENSLRARRLLFGKSLLLMQNGKLFRRNLKKAHLDLGEFTMQARGAGYFDLSAIDTAVMEPSGKISFLPFANRRPVTADDLKILPKSDGLFAHVIVDGQVLDGNLQAIGYDRDWLFSELKARGIKGAEHVLLATLNAGGTLTLFESGGRQDRFDWFS